MAIQLLNDTTATRVLLAGAIGFISGAATILWLVWSKRKKASASIAVIVTK